MTREPAMHIEEFMQLVDKLRSPYFDEDGHGPTVGDMVAFSSGCPELCRKEKTLTKTSLSCRCIGLFPYVLTTAKNSSAVSSCNGPYISEKIEPMQIYLLSCNSEKNFFTDPSSINECVGLLDGLKGTVVLKVTTMLGLLLSFVLERPFWTVSLVITKKIFLLKVLIKVLWCIVAPQALYVQNPVPFQPPGIDAGKVRSLFQWWVIYFCLLWVRVYTNLASDFWSKILNPCPFNCVVVWLSCFTLISVTTLQRSKWKKNNESYEKKQKKIIIKVLYVVVLVDYLASVWYLYESEKFG